MHDVKLGIVDVIEAIADNKFLLGDQLVEIGFSGPDLRASLAAIALAQSELGHARHLYNWSFALQNIDREVTEQTGNGFQQIAQIGNWVELMTWLYTVNVAAKIVLAALYESEDPDVAKRVPKMLRELDEPITFGREWCTVFTNESGSIPKVFSETFGEANAQIEKWLEAVEHSEALKQAHYLKSQRLTQQYRESVKKFDLVITS
ncbi:phenylacetate-CoA oxygenase subunit PaaI [Fodinisporobacter ferrooxydans]|uniref:Phenylacetate-CoA oxygenase subunit PaaI n=1 Tax=Fodinisporobacter ferrooxydans TaxID=2901836 RepID=A0ABY4CG81_9BACL|nr:phenylacetate-CoA oxygenase subunit PaaI [Alicyclobacillaceae bacterium MYW30-H2]